jgi:hypothetical protein
MAGFGIQKKGTSPLLATREKFAEGSDPFDLKYKRQEEGVTDKKTGKTNPPYKKFAESAKRVAKATKIGKIAGAVAATGIAASAYLRSKMKDIKEKQQSEKSDLKRKEKAKGGSVKDTHITKDGRVAKKGLYYYMNRAKKLGKSKPGKGTVSDKALKASAKTAKK